MGNSPMFFNNADEVLRHAMEAKQNMDRASQIAREPVVIPPDAIWVVDKKSGCHFKGRNLIHTDACLCDWEDQ